MGFLICAFALTMFVRRQKMRTSLEWTGLSRMREACIMLRIAVIGVGCLVLLCQIGLAPLSGVQPQPDAAAERDLQQLQGVWHHVSREQGGKETAGESKDSLFVVRGNIVVLKTGDKVGQVGVLKIVDAKSTPRKLDLIITDGANEGMTILAVYKVEGDFFKYCGAINARPTALATSPDDKEYVYCSTYKKLKR
jgi:uncharacterized protein (TIGR03067 family)